jgi:hypothetical protein
VRPRRAAPPPPPAGIHPAVSQATVEPAVTAAMFPHQRQLQQRPDRAVRTHNGIGRLAAGLL